MQRKFLPFFITQFGGAFNDTLFKTTLTLLVTFYAGVYTTLSTAMAVNVISALFILPFVFVSSTAGQLADKLDQAVLMRGVKVFEVVILSVAFIGFIKHAAVFLYLCVFLHHHQPLLGKIADFGRFFFDSCRCFFLIEFIHFFLMGREEQPVIIKRESIL